MTLTALIRFLEITAIVESWFAAAWLFRHIQPQKAHSISRHGGADSVTYRVFGLTLSFHAIVFALFAFIWIAPRFHAGPVFLLVASAAATLQFLTAWIRDGVSPRLSAWHAVTAYGMAFTMPVMLALLITGAQLPPVAHITSWVAAVAMAVVFTAALTNKQNYGRYLYFQSAYVLCFQLAIITLALTN